MEGTGQDRTQLKALLTLSKLYPQDLHNKNYFTWKEDSDNITSKITN